MLKKILRITGIILIELLLIIGFLFSSFIVINTMVSIKYETVDGDGCITLVSGNNLCLIKLLWIVVAVLFLLLSIGWIIFVNYKRNRHVNI